MIAIVNVGPHDDPDKLGVRTYEVRINANVVCTFKHRRADDLGMCLLKASKAVERQKWEQASRILDIANADDNYPGHSGWYCGNREQFVKRHKKAVALMRSLLAPNTGA